MTATARRVSIIGSLTLAAISLPMALLVARPQSAPASTKQPPSTSVTARARDRDACVPTAGEQSDDPASPRHDQWQRSPADRPKPDYRHNDRLDSVMAMQEHCAAQAAAPLVEAPEPDRSEPKPTTKPDQRAPSRPPAAEPAPVGAAWYRRVIPNTPG